MKLWLAVLIVLASASASLAHVTELAVLKLTALGEGRYTVAWEMRPNTDVGSALEPVYPSHCIVEDMTIDCGSRDLVGPLSFDRIGEGQSAAMFRISNIDGETQVYTVTPSRPVAEVLGTFDAQSFEGLANIAGSYISLGIEHILKGIDHLLFVLGLIWISRTGWMLFKTITAFTVAHSVTLIAVTFGWIGVPEPFVNTMIALSIVFIGIEALRAQAGRQTLTLRFPWVVSFFFGLLHGAGFASALSGLGLPDDAIPLALVSFNVGVELGQIAFVLVVLAMLWAYRTMGVIWPRWSAPVPAYAVGGLAAFWFFDRVDALFSIV